MKRNAIPRFTGKKLALALAISAGLGGISIVNADEHEGMDMEPSAGQQKVIDKIAGEYQEFAGDDSTGLVEALRNGDELSYEIEVEQLLFDENGDPVFVQERDENGELVFEEVPVLEPELDENGDEVVGEDGQPVLVPALDENGEEIVETVPVFVRALDENGEPLVDAEGNPVYVQDTELVIETVLVENRVGGMGYGEIDHAMSLARALLGEDATLEEIIRVLYGEAGDGLLDMRADGAGWGEIFQAYELKLGHVKQQYKSRKPESMDAADTDGSARVEKVSRAATPEKPAKPEKPVKPVKPEKIARVERPQKPEKPVKPERFVKPEKPELPHKP